MALQLEKSLGQIAATGTRDLNQICSGVQVDAFRTLGMQANRANPSSLPSRIS
jgi:hypothetical protein